MEEVVLFVVLLVEVLAKKRQLKVQAAVLVETAARAEVAVLVLVGKSWEQGKICLIINIF